MYNIWKYSLKLQQYQTLEMPKDAEILTLQFQQNAAVIWVKINPENKKEKRKFRFAATGETIKDNNIEYIGTLQFEGGNIIQHLFEIIDNKRAKPNNIEIKNLFVDNDIPYSAPISRSKLILKKAEINDKIKGAIYGHAIGNALGLGTQFFSKEDVELFYPKGFSDYNQIIKDKHRSQWEKGQWTGDTEQMLCVLDSILQNKEVNYMDVAHRLHQLAVSDTKSLDKPENDILTARNFRNEPHKVAKEYWIASGEKYATNGAIIQTAILGLWQFDNIKKTRQNTEQIAKIIHYDPRCVGSSVVVSIAISMILQGYSDVGEIINFVKNISTHYDQRIYKYIEIAESSSLEKFKLADRTNINYTLKAIGSGLWVLKNTGFKSGILKIINEGGDAETNATIAGTLLGAKYGYNELPENWINGLKNKNELDKRIDLLINIHP